MRRFLDDIAATLLTLGALGLIYMLPSNISFLDPVGQALSDFDLTDIVFSKLRNPEEVVPDTSMVIVNIAHLDRADIAEEIKRIALNNPRVIGVDAFFRRPKQPEVDSALASALQSTPNVVLVSQLGAYNSNKETFDSLTESHSMFSAHASTGYANMITDQAIGDNEFDARTVRTFSPKELVGNTIQYPFAAVLAKHVDSVAYNDLYRRGNSEETINFRGNYDKFYTVDAGFVLDPASDLSFMRGKAVLMGYLGDSLGARSLEDVFFTPMNEHSAGKTYPDMYGVLIHANILSTILRREYFTSLPRFASTAVSAVICLGMMMLMSWVMYRFESWYDPAKTLLGIFGSLALLFLIVLAFAKFWLDLNITIAVAAVALAGPIHELYHNLLKHTMQFIRRIRVPKVGRKNRDNK